MSKKKLALFDMDGTLFDTNDVNYYAYKEAVEHFGYKIDYDYWYANCIGAYYKKFLGGIGITDEAMLEEIHELKKRAYSKYLKYAKINEHLFALIELMKPEYYVVLVTAASKANVLEILNTFGKIDVFDKMYMQEDVKKLKPDPEGYLTAMKHFNIKPEDTIIFEDSEPGLAAAEASGAYYFKVFKFNLH